MKLAGVEYHRCRHWACRKLIIKEYKNVLIDNLLHQKSITSEVYYTRGAMKDELDYIKTYEYTDG